MRSERADNSPIRSSRTAALSGWSHVSGAARIEAPAKQDAALPTARRLQSFDSPELGIGGRSQQLRQGASPAIGAAGEPTIWPPAHRARTVPVPDRIDTVFRRITIIQPGQAANRCIIICIDFDSYRKCSAG